VGYEGAAVVKRVANNSFDRSVVLGVVAGAKMMIPRLRISMLSPSKDTDSLAVIYFLTKDIMVGKTESLELITVYCTYEVFSTFYCEQ